MSERYTVNSRIGTRVGPNRRRWQPGDTVAGDQLRKVGIDVEAMLATGAIEVCKDKPKAKAEVKAEVKADEPKGRFGVTDG